MFLLDRVVTSMRWMSKAKVQESFLSIAARLRIQDAELIMRHPLWMRVLIVFSSILTLLPANSEWYGLGMDLAEAVAVFDHESKISPAASPRHLPCQHSRR